MQHIMYKYNQEAVLLLVADFGILTHSPLPYFEEISTENLIS